MVSLISSYLPGLNDSFPRLGISWNEASHDIIIRGLLQHYETIVGSVMSPEDGWQFLNKSHPCIHADQLIATP